MAGMVVKNNLSALNTLNVLNANHTRLSKSLAKVSSGMRINGAADDASGYAISERMRAQIRSLDQANRNTQNGSSMLKVAEGAVSSTVELLKTLKEKVINAANDTNTDEDRATIQKELDQSIDQINDNANVTYNGKYLVDGSKNSIGTVTYTALTNKKLSTTTTAGTLLTKLKNRNDEDLGISSTDKVTISYVQEGQTYTTTFSVGNNSLQQIFVKVEAVDPTGFIFADMTNPSVATASGIDPSNMASIRAQLMNDFNTALANWQTAQGITSNRSQALSAAQSTYSTYKANTYDPAVTATRNSFNSLDAFATNSTFSSTANSYAVGLNWRGATGTFSFSDDYADWSGRRTSLGYPDPSVVASATSNTVGYVVQQVDTASQNAISAGNTANWAYAFHPVFDAYATAYSNLSAATTNLATYASAITTAQSDLDVARADEAAKKDLMDQALATYNATFGPRLLEGENLGVDRAGNTVMTATRENAITVTAGESGLHGQISGLTISVTDSEGNVKKSVNAALDAFNESIRAEEGCRDNALVLQTGTRANQSIKIGLSDMRARALGLQGSDGSTLNIGTQKKANAAINVLDNAIQKALDEQTKIGAIQSRLEYTSANLTTASENVRASESAIRDADMAKEMTEYARNNVLLQAAQYMLAQANQNSSSVLGLLT